MLYQPGPGLKFFKFDAREEREKDAILPEEERLEEVLQFAGPGVALIFEEWGRGALEEWMIGICGGLGALSAI